MSFEFKLPDIGEGIAEGEITQWLVEVGQTVQEDGPFVEVMTDKATVEIPAPKSGVIKELRVAAGDSVPVGDVIAVIETEAGAGVSSGSTGADSGSAPEPAAAPVVEASPPAAPVAAAVAAAGKTSGAGTAVADRVRILAAPAVRRRAREHGIDLSTVPASGAAGRVTREDLDSFLQHGGAVATPIAPAAPGPAAPAQPVTVGTGGEQRIPLRGIRKRVAARMSQSKNTAAHFTYVDEVDVTDLVELRASLKEAAAEEGVKLTYMPFIIQAVMAGLRKFPMLNSSLDESTQEIVVKDYFNIGFAADTEAGLVVPVIHGAQDMSLLGLGAAVADLANRAREGKLLVEEVSGSTFTITNAGTIGGILATPIINYPEVAILGVHKIAEQAVVRDGEIVIRKMMNLSISLDHRLIDGADGARYMNEVIRLLEDPRRLLLGRL